MQNPGSGRSSRPGPFVSGRPIVPQPLAPSTRPRPFSPAPTQSADPVDVEFGAPEATPVATDSALHAASTAGSAEWAQSPGAGAGPEYEPTDGSEGQGGPMPGLGAEHSQPDPEPGLPVEPTADSSHWVMATYRAGMEEDIDEPLPYPSVRGELPPALDARPPGLLDVRPPSLEDAPTLQSAGHGQVHDEVTATQDDSAMEPDLGAQAAERLESVAQRLRDGQIQLPHGSSVESDAAVIASVLSAILGVPR